MSKQALKKGLQSVFSSIQDYKCVLEDLEIFNNLLKLLSEEPNLNAFIAYLESECGLSPKIIAILAERLMLNPDVKKQLGNKITRMWLLFKTFETLDILKNIKGSDENKLKRSKVSGIIANYKYSGSNLQNFLKACCGVIGSVEAEEIADMTEMIMENRNAEISQIFLQQKVQEPIVYNSDKSIEEQLIDYQADYELLPQGSFLKELQREIILAHVQKNPSNKNKLTLSKLKSDINSLKAVYNQQFTSVPLQIEDLFKKINSKVSDDVYDGLCALKTKVFAINVLELERLISKTNEAKIMVDKKDVIFMIGNTGSGKSTNILRFLGYKLKLGKFGDLTTLVPTEALKTEHKTFYTSPEAKSCTRYINAVAVPDNMYKKGQNAKKKTLVICDSPGFGDSAGVEVDIANGVGMINALYESRSVRVVVILPYDSLTADRMAGAIKMSEIISNLFHQLTVMESIAVYFNKVPQDKIAEVPAMITSKMKYLTEVEKSNEKLITFIKEILERSQDEENYIDPINGDYKSLFNKIVSMQAITQVRKNVQYDFTSSTKRQIDKFIQNQRSRVKDSYYAKKYIKAEFHLRMIYKLMAILNNNDKIQGYYRQLAKFIEEESLKELNFYEDLIMQIINLKETSNIKDKLKESSEKIKLLQKLFIGFKNLTIPSARKIDLIIQENKDKLLNQFNNLAEVTIQTILAVKSFSALLDEDLQKEVTKIIERNFNRIYAQVQQQAKFQNYSEMGENLKQLTNLMTFSSHLSQKSGSNTTATTKMRDLKNQMIEEVDRGFTEINDCILKEDSRVTENIVKEVNIKIEQIKAIETLRFLENSSEIRTKLANFLRSVEGKCKKIIRDLQNLRLSLNEEVEVKNSIQKDELSTRKKQIELLMRIENIGLNLTDDYLHAKDSIARKQRENVDILRNCIQALKGNKNDEIYKSLESIKKATLVVLQCSKLVDDSGDGLNIAQSIESEFIKYLNGELTKIHSIEIKINLINEQSLQKIKAHYNNIDSYAKMGMIGPQINQSVMKLREQFSERLIAPYKEYKQRDINALQQKKNYKSLSNDISKFEKFSLYALSLQDDIVSPSEYNQISNKCETDIKTSLENIYKLMDFDIEKFLNQPKLNNPPFLKDLIKTLLVINSKSKSCQYLARRLSFDVAERLNNIHTKLEDIKDQIGKAFEASHSQVEHSQELLTVCKFYSDIEDVYKSKGEPDKFGFKELLKNCQDQFNKTLKNDEARIKQIIIGNKPSKISFTQLQTFYNKFLAINTQEGITKRRFITNQLKKVEYQILDQLREFRNEIEDLAFIKNSNKIDDFLEVFYEAVQLEKLLNQLYKNQDKRLINIKKSNIRKIGIKIINVFESEFTITREQLKNYNIDNIEQKLKTFGSLESMIYEVFNLEHQEQNIEYNENQNETPEDFTEDTKQLKKFIDQNASDLKKAIQAHEFIKEGKINAKNTKRLKNLLQIFKQGLEQQIKVKYTNYGSDFKVDNNFSTYYSYANEEKRKNLKLNVDKFLKEKYKQYTKEFNNTSDIKKQVIDDIIKLLPTELNHHHTEQFEKIITTLIQQSEGFIDKFSKSIINDPANIDNFFAQAQKANAQTEYHQKWVNKLEEIYFEYEQKDTSIDEKLTFVESFFIGVFQKHKTYLKADQEMNEMINRKYKWWLKLLRNLGDSSINKLKALLENTNLNNDQRITHCQKFVQTIFKIYNFSIKFNEKGIQDHKKFRQQIFDSFQQKLEEIIEYYRDIMNKKPEDQLNSNDILEPTKIANIQLFIEAVSLTGGVLDMIKKQLKTTQNLQRKSQIFDSIFLKSIYSVQPYHQVLQSYENQIEIMHNFLNTYKFFDDIKRNMAPKEIQDDLAQLDHFYEILEIRRDFFLKYVIKKEHNKYDFKAISSQLLQKFLIYVKDVQEEIVEVFKSIDGEQELKVNHLIKQLNIMRGRQRVLKFICPNKVQDIHKQLIKQIKSKFQQTKEDGHRNFETLKKQFNMVSMNVQDLLDKRRKDIDVRGRQYKKKINDETKKITNRIQGEIKREQEQDKKKQLRDKMNLEISSITNEQEKEKNEDIMKIEQSSDIKVKSLYDNLSSPISTFTKSILILQKAYIDIYQQAEKYKKILEGLLEGLLKYKDPKLLRMIETSLQKYPQDQRKIGMVILTSNSVFQHFKVDIINKLIKGQDIKYVLNHLQKITPQGRKQMPNNQIKLINSYYQIFKKNYDQHKDKYKNNPFETTINYMVRPLKDLGNHLKAQFYQSQKPRREAESKIQLLAGIFALWAILKSETYDGQVEYTIEPHPTQITTLILLLAITQPDEKMSNRLAQVGTGEGKSIVLAGLSCYLALVGFKVRCACYSSYLSSRDQESFKILFQKFGVQNSIKYGTFNALCQDLLNSGGSDFKAEVEKMLLQPPKGIFQRAANFFLGKNLISLNRGSNQILQNPTIMIIDEVDVFFEDRFFGNTYCPGISLRGPEVKSFLERVWKAVNQHKDNIDPKKLISGNQFKQLKDKYPSIQELLKNQVHGMIAGALNYKHDYLIIDKRIGYKDNDSISYNINYGYKTAFAYLHELQHNKVSSANVEKAMQISLMVAEFAYAALPKYFANILGVTGTLEVLPFQKKKLLYSLYNINDQYAIPSAFGINKKRIQQYTITPMEQKELYYDTIINKIKQVKDNRPIIIFFNGPRELNEFFNQPKYLPFAKRTSNLTEQHEEKTRDQRIYNAVLPNKITLMSSAFGRGTDFVILDDIIKEKGGLHIIQGFLSLDESEEVQIKGRTARQNSQGSYDCIINEDKLEQLNISPEEISKDATSDQIHKIFKKARQERIKKISQATEKKLLESDRKHTQVVQIFTKPELPQADLIKYVSILNKYPEIRKVTIKTVLCLDATGSMASALKKTCEIIGQAFSQSYDVLQEKKTKANVEIKIMAYRNYNSPCQEIIEGTTFENTPTNLKRFLDQLKPKGGWVNEALQVLFQFLNREEKIDQVILIGDAPPNTDHQVKSKRNSKGETYWKSKGFPLTNISRQLDIFRHKNSPVHSFYLNYNGAGFNEISHLTGGNSSKFDINSPDATKKLTQFVVENILSLIEKNSGDGKLNLVDTYRRLFMK